MTTLELPPETDPDAMEEWILAHVQDPSVPFGRMAVVLARLARAGASDRAGSGADLLAEALTARRDEAGFLSLLELRASWQAGDPSFCAAYGAQVASFFKHDRAASALIKPAGFVLGGPIQAALRRFRLLRRLQPGVLCYEKTWGFGVVASVDSFMEQVIVDFEGAKGHRMALAYAADTLVLLTDDHLLTRRHRDPVAFGEWLRREPAEAVTCALRSFGPMPAARLQELMTAYAVPAAEWKRFWDSARAALKKNPLVAFPARRTEPLRLLDKAPAYDDDWRRQFLEEREFRRILDQAESLKAALPDEARTAPLREALENRLAFVVQGSENRDWGVAAHALLLGDELGVTWRGLDPAALTDRLLGDTVFLEAMTRLPARRLRPFLACMQARAGARLLETCLRLLPGMTSPALTDALEHLERHGRLDPAMAALRDLLAAGRASCEIAYWLCRHPGPAARHGLGTPGSLAFQALAALDAQEVTGERLKARHQVRALFEQPDWLRTVLDSLDVGERRHLVRRFKRSPAWSMIDRNAILARFLKLDPSLGDALQDDAGPAPAPPARLTSLRSYRQRQAQLDRLVRDEIPRNSQDIAAARAYGDLSENFEYKAAKDMQGILLRRRGELETMLAAVRGTDFAGTPADAAGPGTRVSVRPANGPDAIYTILGEWDHEESLGIIASLSKLAQALAGRRPGDAVSLPGPDGDTPAVVTAVSPLPPEIQEWIRAEP